MSDKLDDETWAKRVADAVQDGKLNISYMDLPSLDVEKVLEIKEKIPNLVELDMRSNDLAELPDELAELKYLRNVKLTYNRFEVIPAVLTKLKRLTSLNMGGCLVREVDATVADLSKNLTDLDVSGNRVQVVSPAIANCTRLTYLNLENNSIASLPEEMGTIKNLEVLDLSNNNLVSLPDTFGGLTGLKRIEVNNNKIEELPPSMGHLTNLKEFDVRYNELREPGRTKALGPLAGLLKFLRDEEQRLIQEEIERLKPVATQVGRYLEYRTKIEIKGNNEGNGGPSDPMDDRPYLRQGHSITYGANHLFIFGGSLAYHDKSKVHDLFVTNLDRMVWRKTHPKGQRPCDRDGHASVFDHERRRLLIFGGKSKEKKRLDDLFAYYLDEDRWVQLSPDGRRPDARECATMTCVDKNTAVLFGGKGQGQRFNDVVILDMSTKNCVWTTPLCSGPVPTPRQDVAMSASDGVVYLHAGRDNFVRDDLYSLDLSDKQNPVWEELTVGGRKPATCYSHVLACIDGKVFTFGGFDELGGSQSKMFRLDLADDAAFDQTSDGWWTEMESELNLNESRIGVISPDGVLHVLQVGSKRSESQTSGEEMYWDRYKVAEVLDFDARVLRPEDLVPVNGKKLRVEHCTTSNGKEYPVKVRTRLLKNTEREQKILTYVNDFKRKFPEFYPHRRELLLDAKNECGVSKFVCTTVRPSKLDYTSLYDLRPCCEFVANYLEYEELESPLLFPSALPSPYTVMEWQAGDCFDLATTLCSLLTGVGFDAYVCVGYAPKRITTCDQTMEMCPVLEREAALRAQLAHEKANAPVPEKKISKYKVKQLIDLTSTLEIADEKHAREEARRAKEAVKALKRLEKEERRKQAEAEAAAADALEAEAAAAVSPGKPTPVDETASAEAVETGGEDEKTNPDADANPEETLEAVPEAEDEPVADADAPEPDSVDEKDATEEAMEEHGDAEDTSHEPEVAVDPKIEEARLDKKYDGKRVHAWVLVRAGKREVEETVFVEPTTARRYSVNESPYQGLEFLWNHINFWVNAQGSDKTTGNPNSKLTGIDFDLDDQTKWEACLEVERIEIAEVEEVEEELEEEKEEEEEVEVAEEAVVEGEEDEKDPDEKSTEDDEDEKDDDEDEDDEDEETKTDVQSERPDPSENGDPTPADQTEPENEFLDHDPDLVTVEMPPSWVPKLKISQEAFDTVCPRGHKTTKYAKCQHEIFAVFGPCMRWDGMVERLCIFEDEACLTLVEERQDFQRRKDRLSSRVSFPADENKKIEKFNPGAAFGVKETKLVPEVDRHTVFYPGGRQDGLRTRHEIFGVKMLETFENRDDYLVYRVVTYDAEETALRASEAEAEQMAKEAAERAVGERRKKPKKVETPPPIIAKVTQKFELPDIEMLSERRLEDDPDGPEVPSAQHWLRKRVFNLKNGTIRCEYHFGEGKATANQSVYFKDNRPAELIEVDPTVPDPSDVEVAENFHQHRVAEKLCVADLRDVENECDEILKNRVKEEQAIELLLPYYDAMRVKVEDDDEEEVEMKKTLDYLDPFIPPLLAGESMTTGEAHVTREKALAALQAELDQRWEIIKKRAEEENQGAAKRHAVYKRDVDLLTKKEEAAYHAANENTVFLLRLLEQRQRRHDANAERKMKELDERMRKDERMKAMYAEQ